jgi:membrane protein DedA with SNARE-associated domain
MTDDSRGRFFLTNFIRGILVLFAFVIAFILFKKYITIDFLQWLQPVYDNTVLVIIIFTLSEIIFGIIPPEIFFIWSTRWDDLERFVFITTLLAVISYLAGILGFWIGVKLNRTILYRWIKRRYLLKYQKYLNKFGFFLIIVAALTPLPFSAISMLMGSVNYPFKKFGLFALARFVRFGYAVVFWEINMIS